MNYPKEEILAALKMLQEICCNTECEDCPFRNFDDNCAITDTTPDEWAINDVQSWRAFD